MKFARLLLPSALLLMSACSQAEPPAAGANLPGANPSVASAAAPINAQTEAAIRNSLKLAIPDAEITSVKTTPFPGLYEIKAKGYGSAYMSADGRFMLQGELIEINGNKLVNITEQGMADERKVALSAISPKDAIIFPAVGKTKGVAYVFTDIDCGYCRKLHNEVPQMNQLGIEIRYLAFPRSGYPSPIAKRMEAIWCSPNPKEAMTQAKQGQFVTGPECAAPVKAQFELGQELGVRGTPAIFLENGTQVGGYLPPKDLAAAMNIK